MASITKHKGKWRAQVYKAGVRRSKVFPTQGEAKRWAARTEHLLDGANNRDKVLFSTVLDRYAHEVSEQKRGRDWEQRQIRRMLKHKLASMFIAEISTSDLVAWREERLAVVSNGTILREMNLFSHVFQIARREWGYIDRSPMTDVTRPTAPQARRRRPQKAEIEAMGFVAGRDYTKLTARVYAAFLFACETAMRAGEIASLTSETVDYARRVAHLPETKNGEARDVPLTTEAVRILQSMPDQERMFNVTADQISSLFARLRKKAAVDGLTFHDSRREGTVRLSKKLDVMQLARVTGHKDIKMLLTYYHEEADELARLLD